MTKNTADNIHFECNYTLTNGDIVTVDPGGVTVRDSENHVLLMQGSSRTGNA